MTASGDKYTDPELRNEIKETIHAGDKGGKPGQWSARKAQMMASEYRKATHEKGEEPYKTDASQKDERQESLTQWGKEDWQTSDGKGKARQEDGSERRYLPKKAWEQMSDQERRETDAQKFEGSKDGKQNVPNTEAAKEARRNANEDAKDGLEDDEEDDEKKEEEQYELSAAPIQEDNPANAAEKLHTTNVEDNAPDGEETPAVSSGTETSEIANTDDEGDDKEFLFDGDEEITGEEVSKCAVDEDTVEAEPAAKKAKDNAGSAKATKSVPDSGKERKQAKASDGKDGVKRKEAPKQQPKASKDSSNASYSGEMNEYGQPGSATRLPSEGQTVHWKSSMWVEGTVVAVLFEATKLGGRTAKASKEDPRIVLRSAKSGKEAAHKPEAVYF